MTAVKPAASSPAPRRMRSAALLACAWMLSFGGIWWIVRAPAGEAGRLLERLAGQLEAFEPDIARLEAEVLEARNRLHEGTGDPLDPWASVRTGLFFDDIRALLGEASSVSYRRTQRVWTYARPEYKTPGEITFDARGRVVQWTMPQEL